MCRIKQSNLNERPLAERSHGAASLIAGLFGLLVMTSHQVAAALVVVPNGLATAEGNAASEFLTGDPRAVSVRYQQVFASSEFSGVGTITEIRFRPDAVSGFPFSASLSNVRIGLSTSAATPDGLSATFANNVGGDETVVFNGDLTLTSADLAGPGGSRAFDIVISLTTPFTFDPGLGNLLFDFQRDASSLSPLGVSFDAQYLAGDSISRAFGSRASLTANFGVDTAGLTTLFTVVPEPHEYGVLAAIGLVGFALWRRCAAK